MKQAILDSSFIISAIRQKIDFFEDLEFMGLEILIPKQVIEEIKRVAHSNKKLHVREDAKLALKVLDAHKFKQVEIKGKHVDKGIVNFAKQNPGVIVAVLDREIKRAVTNNKVVIKGRKKLEII